MVVDDTQVVSLSCLNLFRPGVLRCPLRCGCLANLAMVLQHDQLEAEAVTKFHALRPPGIGVAE